MHEPLSDSEARLLEKIARIEALIAGPGTVGELFAATAARDRIRARLRDAEQADPPVEYYFRIPEACDRKVFRALLRRYGLEPYRYHRQRATTILVRVSRGFVDDTLWPEYLSISKTLQAYLDEITDRVIAEAIHGDSSDTRVQEGGPAELAEASQASHSQ